ncbi:hypothetical protein TVAG_464470 [Trichomonas vaginalis G3]|uniref:Uncharacterized protein n=1 Tax=Trichomonas vaginalis (strain ATCC PRA-98 / G3) TaxID=412133 RepID=A2EEJ2_TRIV3|nr:hypothetical protein TVAGG3_1054800 [Trichomonas vaginalis G3]EAY08899.1 hypothetical protein TVAG_464470 [Trichomonas vaginalis G3]KAI5494375.1 hypothetical protein TVAGG3_1054800 [Trichomonas vaginalis G3]|eukprot:XP_001321122.1 hypothetical protein [Trichomonas vaginalis G3]
MQGYTDYMRDAEYDKLLYANCKKGENEEKEKEEEQCTETPSNSGAASCIDDFPTQAEVDSERHVELENSTYFV